MRAPHLHRGGVLKARSPLGRALRVAFAIALGALALVALVVGGAAALLQTRAGADAIRRLALPRINARIAGTLAIEKFRFSGGRFFFENVVVQDPEGREALAVARIDLVVAPLQLLRKHLDIRVLALQRPRISLIDDGRGQGIGLARAFAVRPDPSRPPPEANAESTKSGFVVDIRGFQLRDGAITARGARWDDLTANGTLHLGTTAMRVSAVVAGRGITLRGDMTLSGKDGLTALAADLHATAPGTTIVAHGAVAAAAPGAEPKLEVSAEIEASDLGALSRRLATLLEAPLPALSGRGRIEAALSGTTRAPALRLAARFPALRVDAVKARDLVAGVTIPDLNVPEALDVELRAATVVFDGNTIRSPTLSLRAAGRSLSADLQIANPTPLRLLARGRRDPGTRAFTIEGLTLRTETAAWALARPARIEVGPGRLRIAGLALTADRQRLELDMNRGPDGLRGRLTIARLDLGRLPRALVPAGLRLGGTLDSHVALAPRETTVRARIAGGRIRGMRDLAVALDARAGAGRARGKLEARGLSTALLAQFDLPTEWPPRNRRAPLGLDLTLAETEIGPVLGALGAATGKRPPPLRGKASLTARLEGSLEQPTLALDARGRDLVLAERSIGSLALAARGNGGEPVQVSLEATGSRDAPGQVRLTARTQLSLAALLRRPPTVQQLARTPIELRGEIDKVALSLLARLAPPATVPPALRGTLSAQLALSGTVVDPRGSVVLDVAGVAGDGLPPTDGHLELGLEARSSRARASVARKGRTLLQAEVTLAAGLADLRRPAALAEAPLRGRVVVGPLILKRRGLPAIAPDGHGGTVEAHVRAELTVEGTLPAPRLALQGQAEGLRVDRARLGTARVQARYQDRRARLDARFDSANGGALQAEITSSVDLGSRALARGLDLRRVPLEVRVEARGLELGAFAGLVPGVHELGGLLTASLQARGTLAAPRYAGKIEWTKGSLGLSGFGRYRDIHLVGHGDEHKLVLDELTAASGSGRARVTGTAEQGDRGTRLSANVDLERLPVYQEGQPIAQVSIEGALSGRLPPLGTRGVTEVEAEIREARIELSDSDPRKLQTLEVPADIVRVNRGTPTDREQARKLAALAALGPRVGALAAPEPERRSGFRLVVNAPRKIWVTGRDARIEMGVAPGFRVTLDDETRVSGQVVVQRGRVDVLGRRFDIKPESTVRWDGPAERPELNVTAQHENRKENVTVLVTIKGQPEDTKITVSSPNRPELDQAQLTQLLVSGRLQGNQSSGGFSAKNKAASLATGLLASRLQKSLARRLPLDVLSIESGGATLAGTQVEAGRYVTDRLYVGYVGRVGADPTRAQNRNAVHAEFQLTPRWEIEGEYGDAGTGSADVMWKKNY